MSRLLKLSPVFITRRGAVVNVRGRMTEGPSVALTYKGNIQPHSNLNMVIQTYGSNIDGAIKIFTTDRLLAKEDGQGGDIITHDGREWEVLESKHYPAIRPHYMSVAVIRKGQ